MSAKSAAPTYMFVFRSAGGMDHLSPEEMQQSFQLTSKV